MRLLYRLLKGFANESAHAEPLAFSGKLNAAVQAGIKAHPDLSGTRLCRGPLRFLTVGQVVVNRLLERLLQLIGGSALEKHIVVGVFQVTVEQMIPNIVSDDRGVVLVFHGFKGEARVLSETHESLRLHSVWPLFRDVDGERSSLVLPA